jgi:DNA-binding NarL/FixJ family response regulator
MAADRFGLVAGIRHTFERSKSVMIVGEACSLVETLRLLPELRPDVVIVEIAMKGETHVAVLGEMKNLIPDLKVVVLSHHTSVEVVRAAFAAGVSGYVAKEEVVPDLVETVHRVHEGGTYVSPAITRRIVEGTMAQESHGQSRALTKREKEILGLIVQGRKSREIAQLLGIAVRTVHTHRSHIMDKLDVHNSTALAMKALALGLVDVESR